MVFRGASIWINDQRYALVPGRPNSFELFFVDFQRLPEAEGERYTVYIHPKQSLVLQALEIEFDYAAKADTRFLANGYQSWSETRLLSAAARIRPLRSLIRTRLGASGDDLFSNITRKAGFQHSWTYTLLKTASKTTLLGSLSERTGFTILTYHTASGRLSVRKDLTELRLEHSFPALDIWWAAGDENVLFDRYFKLQNLFPRKKEGALGWTSWYNYYTNISETIIHSNLNDVAESGLPFRYFQIDDGWQTSVGDWLSVKSDFPSGMGAIASHIRNKNLIPGLWLSPFVAAGKSELVQKHPEWLLKSKNGRPVRAGWNALWGGWFYALDFYHPGLRDYLSGVFHVILDRWQFTLVKLDFLYAAALQPPPGKTRGQVMYEAMEFLRQQVGNREILACGLPLGAGFGLADYCRIGNDVYPKWEHNLAAFLRLRERVSSPASLRSTLNRRQLDGYAFGNDPDVFILRKKNQNLTMQQQETLLRVNALCGSLLFTSDEISAYTEREINLVHQALELQQSIVLDIQEIRPDVYQVKTEKEGQVVDFEIDLNRK